MRPRRPHPDANQRAIIAELRVLPFIEVYDISSLSDSVCPGDILVLDKATNRWQPFEIKTRHGRVSYEQIEMSEYVPIVREVEDVLKVLGRMS